MRSERDSAIAAEALLGQAAGETGLNNWGDPAFREPLDMLCRSGREEARLEGAAAAGFAGNLKRLLVNRLRFYDDLDRYPEIGAQKIVAPLIVVGLPRSGTTILHSLLSQDPAVRSPQKWEVDEPSPPPRRETYDSDPRIAVCAAAVDRLEPEFRAMHQVEATLPEECNGIMMPSLQSLNFWAATRLPAYSDWLLDQADMRPAYRFHKQFLQHHQAFASGARWVLKAPPHLLWMDVLMETYPDARIVVTHRDPAQVLPSNASLIAFLRRRAADVDPHGVGEEQVRIWGEGVRRTMAYRASAGDDGRFLDTYYADFVRAPLDTVKAIYRHFDLLLTTEAESRMVRFMEENRQGKHGEHSYTPEMFGLSAARVHRDFAEYIDHYRIKTS